MGCAGSKDVTVADVYRPPPTSVSLFDVSAIEEPWLIATGKKNDGDEEEASDEEDEGEEEEEEEEEEEGKKPTTTVMPLPLLDKLDGYDLAPASWSEVSKALEDIKPTLNSNTTENAKKKTKKKKKKKKKKKQPPPPTTQPEPGKAPSVPATAGEAVAKKAAAPSVRGATEEVDRRPPPPELTGRRVVKDNPFLMRDRENKGNDGAATAAAARWRRRDPFEGYPERRPPGASGGGVVLYTTTLRGVRRTFEDCERARQAVETCAEAVSAAGGSPVVVDERDVSLHGEYLRELRELAGEGEGGAAPPRLFVMGRYLGGADACAELAESGKLREMMRWARARGEACAAKDGRGCEGCGGARFVPCWECGGSCKVVAAGDAGDVERCAKCNENGLMLCPICH